MPYLISISTILHWLYKRPKVPLKSPTASPLTELPGELNLLCLSQHSNSFFSLPASSGASRSAVNGIIHFGKPWGSCRWGQVWSGGRGGVQSQTKEVSLPALVSFSPALSTATPTRARRLAGKWMRGEAWAGVHVKIMMLFCQARPEAPSLGTWKRRQVVG